eukprot:10577342-Alexandrium_andersonii.AAC.1
MSASLVGSEMCIRDSWSSAALGSSGFSQPHSAATGPSAGPRTGPCSGPPCLCTCLLRRLLARLQHRQPRQRQSCSSTLAQH